MLKKLIYSLLIAVLVVTFQLAAFSYEPENLFKGCVLAYSSETNQILPDLARYDCKFIYSPFMKILLPSFVVTLTLSYFIFSKLHLKLSVASKFILTISITLAIFCLMWWYIHKSFYVYVDCMPGFADIEAQKVTTESGLLPKLFLLERKCGVY